MLHEPANHADAAQAGFGVPLNDQLRWGVHWQAAYYDGDWTADEIDAGLAGAPSEVREASGNLLVTAGITAMLNLLIGAGGTAFNNANAYLGVGDSTTAAAIGQTDLQAATNKLRKAMDATYPSHTDGTGSGAATVTFRATFGSSDANFAWQEWIVANSPTAGTGRALNRKVESLGTKASGTTWVFTVTLTLA